MISFLLHLLLQEDSSRKDGQSWYGAEESGLQIPLLDNGLHGTATSIPIPGHICLSPFQHLKLKHILGLVTPAITMSFRVDEHLSKTLWGSLLCPVPQTTLWRVSSPGEQALYNTVDMEKLLVCHGQSELILHLGCTWLGYKKLVCYHGA